MGVREDSTWILCRVECILSHYEARFIRYPRLDTQIFFMIRRRLTVAGDLDQENVH